MLIVEEMYLLLSQDNATTDRARAFRRYGLAAAALADLAQAGFITLAERGKDPKVTVVRAGMTGHAPLDAILPALDRSSGRTLSKLVASSRLSPDAATARALTHQGILHEESKPLGASTFTTVNPAPEIALRERLGQVLSGSREATEAERTHLALLKALNVAHGLLGPARGDLDRSSLSRRIESLAQEVPVAEAVQRIVDPFSASTMTLATAPGSAEAA